MKYCCLTDVVVSKDSVYFLGRGNRICDSGAGMADVTSLLFL